MPNPKFNEKLPVIIGRINSLHYGEIYDNITMNTDAFLYGDEDGMGKMDWFNGSAVRSKDYQFINDVFDKAFGKLIKAQAQALYGDDVEITPEMEMNIIGKSFRVTDEETYLDSQKGEHTVEDIAKTQAAEAKKKYGDDVDPKKYYKAIVIHAMARDARKLTYHPGTTNSKDEYVVLSNTPGLEITVPDKKKAASMQSARDKENAVKSYNLDKLSAGKQTAVTVTAKRDKDIPKLEFKHSEYNYREQNYVAIAEIDSPYSRYYKSITDLNAPKFGNKVKESAKKPVYIDVASMGMAAVILEKQQVPFSSDAIKKKAAQLKRDANLDDLSNDVYKSMLSRKDSLKKCGKSINKLIYGIGEGKDTDEFFNKMEKLYRNMMSDEGRTPAYKAFYAAVKKLATSPLRNNPDEIANANADLLEKITAYQKGKKKVRSSDDGKARFDNSMDALAILDEYCPGLRKQSRALVARTNHVRGVEGKKTNKYYVDLKKFGADNAAAKKEERDLKNAPKKAPKQAKAK